MNLDIAKDKRAKKFFHHLPSGINAMQAKSVALKDIQSECGQNKLYSRCYLHVESLVLKLTNLNNQQ